MSSSPRRSRRWDEKASTCMHSKDSNFNSRLMQHHVAKNDLHTSDGKDSLDNIKKVGRAHAQDKHGGTCKQWPTVVFRNMPLPLRRRSRCTDPHGCKINYECAHMYLYMRHMLCIRVEMNACVHVHVHITNQQRMR